MSYRIMSFDGGGVRGVYTARLLERLTAQVPEMLAKAELLAGTSTGGIIALALAAGHAVTDLVALYRDNAPKIFDKSWLHDLAELDGLAGAEYDNRNLELILAGEFATTRLDQLNKRVLIPSFQLDNQDPRAGQRKWKPKFFHNYPGPQSDGTELVVDVALRTSAAPIYFPTYQIYVDGGVVANDPSMAALAQALDRDTGGQKLEDLYLFSLGTGTNPTYIPGHDLDWGLAQWAKPLVSLMIDGVMGVAEYQCAHLLGQRYFRLQPLLPKPIALDDAAAVDDLIAAAEQVDITAAVDWLHAQFVP
jgi:patatin-like phospholipase/acyl hydrolase